MKRINLFFQKVIYLFASFFKTINENSGVNVLNSISKDEYGNTILFISSLSSDASYPIYPHQIISTPYLKNQFKNSDIKIIESIIISEGDVFIIEKEYQNNSFYFMLRSIISHEEWKLPEHEINENASILNRINKRFFTANKVFKHGYN